MQCMRKKKNRKRLPSGCCSQPTRLRLPFRSSEKSVFCIQKVTAWKEETNDLSERMKEKERIGIGSKRIWTTSPARLSAKKRAPFASVGARDLRCQSMKLRVHSFLDLSWRRHRFSSTSNGSAGHCAWVRFHGFWLAIARYCDRWLEHETGSWRFLLIFVIDNDRWWLKDSISKDLMVFSLSGSCLELGDGFRSGR